MSSHALSNHVRQARHVSWVAITAGLCLLVALLAWQTVTASGNPDPMAPGITKPSAVLDVGVLVFREGLECILVLAAITASMTGSQSSLRRPVACGVGVGAVATLITWFLAVRILNELSTSVSALNLQATTGLLAIVVLLIVMNWFFHKMYWTGWISLHNRKKREILNGDKPGGRNQVFWGMAMLGFTSFYREGFEVVLFLQSYRLRLGGWIVLCGVLVGLVLTSVVAILTFVAHRKLPYKKMLVLTGVMLAVVLFVMVGEQAQEMQLAHWLPATQIPWLANRIPAWMGLWLSVFPTVESLTGQILALAVVLGSYVLAQRPSRAGKSI